FLGQDLAERRRELLRGNGTEIEALAAREDGGGDLARVGGSEYEDHVGRRLLQRLEKGVEGGPRQHVDLVHDIDLEAAAGRRVLHVLAKRPNVVNARIGGGVDLHHVHRRARDDILATGTGAARFGSLALGAGERLREKPRGGGLADAPRRGEEITMSNSPGAEGVL